MFWLQLSHLIHDSPGLLYKHPMRLAAEAEGPSNASDAINSDFLGSAFQIKRCKKTTQTVCWRDLKKRWWKSAFPRPREDRSSRVTLLHLYSLLHLMESLTKTAQCTLTIRPRIIMDDWKSYVITRSQIKSDSLKTPTVLVYKKCRQLREVSGSYIELLLSWQMWISRDHAKETLEGSDFDSEQGGFD